MTESSEKQNEEPLQNDDEMFRMLVEKSPLAIVVSSGAEDKNEYVNPRFTELFGYTVEEIPDAAHWWPLAYPDPAYRDAVWSEWRRKFDAARKDASVIGPLEAVVTARDGSKKDIRFQRVGSGKKDITFCYDLTDHRQAEATLRKSEEMFRTVVENTRDGINLLDLKTGKYVFMNAVQVALTGFSAEEMNRISAEEAFDRVHPDDRHISFEQQKVVAEGLDPGPTEYRWKVKSGEYRWFSDNRKLVRDSHGQAVAMVGISRDITDRKREEAERESLQANLAQSDRLASIGMLAAGVAHEINNPLAYVLYNLQSLSTDVPKFVAIAKRCRELLSTRPDFYGDAEFGDDARALLDPIFIDDAIERLDHAHEGILRIKDIARSLGTFSRVESAELTPVNIRSCIEHAALMAFNEIKYRARFVKDFGPVPEVLATDGKLAQVFLNLLINAAHSIDEGRVEENEIRARTFANGDSVCAEVIDTGRGIAAEHRGKVFQPFFTTKDVGVGTGLGLSICKKIIGDFKGELSFTSEVGKGTRFLVRLPRIPEGWKKEEGKKRESTPAKTPDRGRILVIDDEEGIREIFMRLLKGEYEVVTAESGAVGLAILEKDRGFDGIFCDLMMPKMSGMELHAQLSQLDSNLAERIVFMSGGAFTPKASSYVEEVGNRCVEKPFEAEVLEKMAAEMVALSRS